MNAQLDGRYYVNYVCPVTKEPTRAVQSSRLGKAVMSGDVDAVCRMTRQEQRDLDRQIRVAELRGRTGRAHAWTTLYNHAIKQGKTFTIHLIPMIGVL